MELPTDKFWLERAFGDIVEKSNPKRYLLKLIEYNKLEIIENDCAHFNRNSFPIEEDLQKLMKQRLLSRELKDSVISYGYEGSQEEQHCMVYAILKLCQKMVRILYRKCLTFVDAY